MRGGLVPGESHSHNGNRRGYRADAHTLRRSAPTPGPPARDNRCFEPTGIEPRRRAQGELIQRRWQIVFHDIVSYTVPIALRSS
jgi:hypothetical protein